jgi:hypothetical protein
MAADIIIEKWQIGSALVIAVAVKGLDYVQAFLKDRRERISDERQDALQRDIANNIRGIREGQVAQNGKLSTVVEVNKAYHEEVMRMMKERL